MEYTNKTKDSLVSVAMATYNGERFIKEQIDSILRQTIQNIEIVICDDCSTDNTWEILKEYANIDNRFKIYRNETNIGFVRNFDKVISLCQGDYIALSDQDDIWMENHLSLLLAGLRDKVMTCGNALLVDEEGNSLKTTWKDFEQFDKVPNDDFIKLKSIIFFRNPFQGATMLFRKELISYALPIPQNIGFHDRWLAIVACLCGGINYIDNVVLKYRRTCDNVTSQRKKRSRLRMLLHGWTMGNYDEIDFLLKRTHSIISKSQNEELLRWRHILLNNTHIRKPITIFYLLTNFKSIYNC